MAGQSLLERARPSRSLVEHGHRILRIVSILWAVAFETAIGALIYDVATRTLPAQEQAGRGMGKLPLILLLSVAAVAGIVTLLAWLRVLPWLQKKQMERLGYAAETESAGEGAEPGKSHE